MGVVDMQFYEKGIKTHHSADRTQDELVVVGRILTLHTRRSRRHLAAECDCGDRQDHFADRKSVHSKFGICGFVYIFGKSGNGKETKNIQLRQ